MTEVNPAGWFQNLSTHTAEQFRSYIGAILTPASGAASLKSLGGVHPGLGAAFVVTQNGTPNMSVNIGSGLVFVTGSEGPKQGTYICENDGTVNKAIAASDPTNPRVDIVVAKVQDAVYSGATNAWSLAVVTGVAASSPVAPAAPNNSVILYNINVPASATTIINANCIDKRPFATALGGTVNCKSTTRPTANLYDGLLVYESDTKLVSRYDATLADWMPVSQTLSAANSWNNTISPSAVLTSTALVNFATSIGFVKRYASTRVKVYISLSGVMTAQPCGIVTAVNFTSGTDYEIDRYNFNVAGQHQKCASAIRYITAIAAGSYTVNLRAKLLVAGTFTMDTNDSYTLDVEEIV